MQEIGNDIPCCIALCSKVQDRGEILSTIREDARLAQIPVLACLSHPDPIVLEDAFRDGVDDYIVDGAKEQLRAMIAAAKKEDSWKAVRAPAGQVVLAHPDRLERIRIGRVLKRNGFDVHFASSELELESAIDNVNTRAVIAATDLPGGKLVEVIQKEGEKNQEPCPWIIVAKEHEMKRVDASLPKKPMVSLFEAGLDAEGLTFLMNELLAPAPAGVRKSQRLLYGTPAAFSHEGQDTLFHGYVFNINLGGLYIRTLTPPPLQSRIEVSFRPPFGRGQVVANAQVVWRKQHGDAMGAASPPGMGLQIFDMWAADKAGFETGYQTLLEQSL